MANEDNSPQSLIVCIVNRGEADKIIESAKKAGAQSATIFFARGSSFKEAKIFFGLNLDPAREVILMLVPKAKHKTIMQSMRDSGKLEKAGAGIAFALDVEHIVGLSNLLDKKH